MKCTQAEALIQTALDGRLSPAERARLDAHLGCCDCCRAAWGEYRRLGHTAAEWATAAISTSEPGDAFTTQIMARIAANQASAPAAASSRIPPRVILAVLTLTVLSCWAGPLLTHSVPPISLMGLSSPHADLSFNGLWPTFSHVPQDALGAWNTLTNQPIPTSRWIWGALAITSGVNVLFVCRARGRTQEAAA